MLTSDARTGWPTPLPTVDRRFTASRDATVERVTRAGIPRVMADAWIDAWVESTEGLRDFREAPDFWTLGYRFAVEEYRRGYRPTRAHASSAGRRRMRASAEPTRP